MDKDYRMISCPYCSKITSVKYAEFRLTSCEVCGSTYGIERHDNQMVVYTVQEAYRFDI